ncbi:LuxR C-terminal-related transcriptional regulator [Saccharothrix violaceirubra]|uniref:LuxR family maltose regulon positive regulatory protein n=2 Tax=Saccharothrix violaceirubra TaxID=413306 RepID=A0A7W7T4P0_9PSEU|nr:LuxR C-terminal-related transcriptional regulator [Saccharothrix violaceirubra]MBB4966504.1 LuxR family maltose regulon positive regulatory protein [Saccharothrix violaceirubra]
MSERHDPSETGRPVPPPKLRVPGMEAPLVERDRLHACLDGRTTTTAPPVTLVLGPAGAGKTTALALWARRRSDSTRVAWVTLDAQDDSPVGLWSAIREALPAGLAPRDRLPDLPPATTPEFAAAVIAALDHVTTPVHLVVDDVHLLTDRIALHGLELLVRHTPKSLRLVLSGRSAPPVRLSRLRLEGRLRLVDARDLAFTRAEAEELFAGHRLRVTADALDAIMARTEGWTAGLRLATLVLAESAPAEFSGALPAVADYITEEILGDYDEQVRDFLVATSVCAEVCGDLGAVVAEQPDAGRFLERLSRDNALVSAVDGADGWYRYHPLLRDHLSAELDRGAPHDRKRSHLAAARWHRDAGRAIDALDHAVRAEDATLAAELVAEHGLREVLRGNGDRLHDLVTSTPRMACGAAAATAALAALDEGDLAGADWSLDGVEVGRSPRHRALSAVVRLRRARFTGDLTDALRTLPTPTTGDVALDLAIRLERGIATLWLGDHRAAEQELRAALDLASREGLDHAALVASVHLTAAAAARGDTVGVTDHGDRSMAIAAARGWENRPACVLVYAVLAAEAHRRLDDALARRMVTLAAEALPRHADRTVELAVAAVEAITTFEDAEDPHAVVSALWKQWQGFSEPYVAPHLVASVVPTTQRMALRVGEPGWAGDMVTHVEAVLGTCGELALLQAVVHSQRGRAAQARKVLEPVLRGELPVVVPTTLVDAWLLEAGLVDREGNSQQAHEALRKALATAEPADALRSFHNAGKPVRDLLAKGAGRFGRLDRFATAVLTTVPTPRTGDPDSLTGRERALLVELPSMRTAEEIADSMYVSINTVKTHLRGIYRKLGVSQRRDAVVVARRLGLI